jgi:hypothetical protein
MKAHFYCTSYNNLRIKTDIEFEVPYGYNQYVRKNNDKTYPYTITNYNAFLELIDINGIEEKGIELYGLKEFYGHEDNFGKLNKDFLSNWNKFKPLKRYRLNKGHSENMFGIHMLAWESVLVMFDGGFYFDNITPEELKVLIKSTNGVVKEKAEKLLEVLGMEEEEIEEARETVRFYEKRMQYIVDDHSEEILNEFDGKLYDYDGDKIMPYDIKTGLDCGFLHAYSENKLYNEAKEIVVLYDDEADWMNLRLPYSPQSVTLKKKVFGKVKEVVNDFIGEELYCKTVLD